MENPGLNMRLAAVCSIIMAASAVPASRAASLADFVNPLIGTAGDGQTFPATGVPFGSTPLKFASCQWAGK